MKNLLAPVLVALAATGFSAQGIAAGEHGGHAAMHDDMHGGAQTAAAMAEGLIKKVDKPGGKLTIAHGALPGGMPAMTMAYRVKDPVWLDRLKAGERIRFATDEGMTTIVRFERVK